MLRDLHAIELLHRGARPALAADAAVRDHSPAKASTPRQEEAGPHWGAFPSDRDCCSVTTSFIASVTGMLTTPLAESTQP